MMFSTKGMSIMKDGEPFVMKGFNLGNWMMLVLFALAFALLSTLSLEMIDRGQIKVNSDIDVSSRILATAYASVGRISLALLSAGLFLGSSILCTTAMQPQLLGVPLLGVLGYVGAFVLGAYTVFHILVSRHRLLNNEEPR